MTKTISVTLSCCDLDTEVSFARADAPGFAPGVYRKNILCPTCGMLLILTLRDNESSRVVEQELIDT